MTRDFEHPETDSDLFDEEEEEREKEAEAEAEEARAKNDVEKAPKQGKPAQGQLPQIVQGALSPNNTATTAFGERRPSEGVQTALAPCIVTEEGVVKLVTLEEAKEAVEKNPGYD